MPQSQEERNQPQNSFLASPIMQTPLFAIVAEMNGTLLETMATAQKEWANFVDRRIKEDVAVLRQLMQCRSPADMHRVYSDYFETAFEQYQEQSASGAARAIHCGASRRNGRQQKRGRSLGVGRAQGAGAPGERTTSARGEVYLPPGGKYFGSREAYGLTNTKPGTTLFELALCPIGNVMG